MDEDAELRGMAESLDLLIGQVASLHELAEKILNDACGEFLRPLLDEHGELALKRDVRLMYPIRMVNLLAGLHIVLRALRESACQGQFWDEFTRSARLMRSQFISRSALVTMAWGTTMGWFGNYEHGLGHLAVKLGAHIDSRVSLTKMGNIIASSGVVPGGSRQAFSEHWEASRLFRNMVHGGGVHTQDTISRPFRGGSIQFAKNRPPTTRRIETLWLALPEQSLILWDAIIRGSRVAGVREIVPDLHCVEELESDEAADADGPE